jgi:hypothetical protein
MENEVKDVVTQQQTETDPTVQKTDPGQTNEVSKPDRTFTRDEVTNILKRRIDRYQNSVFNKYGVKDSAGLDDLFNKAKEHDDLIKARDEALEKVAFLGNNIDPDRYDDIRTYFKGKGLQFTEDALKQHLESHPEWVKQVQQSVNEKPKTTITTVGTAIHTPNSKSEQEMAKKIFGDDLFD